ncbi:G-patch domain and KOW motifs-containing protein [Dryobates pubescens]|uniref:G-patch domain and KOW motifs-containing protein n=1 Tax=Dryobates pubescens TaxID=118200 RepID=UPI0023B9EA12|nr:G-patch domain and KOW motifs-containing protein [Dryobates pubescens]
MAAAGGTESGRAAEGGAAAPVSFGFRRKAERRRLVAAGPCAEPPGEAGEEAGDGEAEPLRAVEGKELLSSRPAPPPPKELIIPLLPPAHRWRNPEPPPPASDHTPSDHAPSSHASPDHAPSDPAPPGPLSVEDQAVKELLKGECLSLSPPPLPEARQSQEQGEGDSAPSISIPIPLQEAAPRPQPTPQDYAAVPVAAFGLAMLRGMGWSQGEGIGRTFKQVVKPLEHRLRPRGLGLGAEPVPPSGNPPAGQPPREGEAQGGMLAVGASVHIQAGPHQGLYGKVEGLDPETARAVVRLELGGQRVTLSQHSLKVGAPPSKNSKEKVVQQEAHAGSKRKQPLEEERTPQRVPRRAPPWLRRDLRVRCVDSSFQGGRYYNCKMVVEDMLTPDSCVCRTDEGRLVEGLREAMLETVIPRGAGDRVMVVLGEHTGKVGRILEREPGRSRALVQLERDAAGRVVPLDYDLICHYVGGLEDD